MCGTPPVLSMAALEFGVDTVSGREQVRRHQRRFATKSIELTELFMTLVDDALRSRLHHRRPRAIAASAAARCRFSRGDGYAIMQALIARGVIGDFRAPDILRFGFAPLYVRFADVWDAVDRLQQVMTSDEWRQPRFSVRAAVT